MKIDAFKQMLDRFGAVRAGWPAEARAAAERLMATDPAAARAARAAANLETTLKDAVEPMALDAALVGRIVANLGGATRAERPLRPTPRLAAWAGAAMVALLVGGYAVGLALPQSQGEDAFAGLVFGNSAETGASDAGTLL
jgi:hypothetical protein